MGDGNDLGLERGRLGNFGTDGHFLEGGAGRDEGGVVQSFLNCRGRRSRSDEGVGLKRPPLD